ncbi:hypothetical protein CYLTODRAFT_417357 [Cylindrobasidium torrendii FP15055 ss-10]|uniref:Chloride channel protein n=1 Tax=Cylindrobasidium torrendii FP15055 ss-10 TaxID=1314674 RepID=A0A0D7BRQ4_9AGAR|nr:hypothetical protein CYLTODRAFT_417357 [Cylindrobasidium torrendii FP15055 ss-10]
MTGSESRPTTSGGLGAPSSTTWRRERLLRIGSSYTLPGHEDPSTVAALDNDDERAPLHGARETVRSRSYGTLPRHPPFGSTRRPASTSRRGRPQELHLGSLPSRNAVSTPGSPLTPSFIREQFTARFGSQRPISAYDVPKPEVEEDISTKINGVRVWYSSFSSIDWMHDIIKDSARYARLRRRKSVRSRLRLALDRALGWIIVTVVGILTAIVAFLVVRSEQWLFDLKEGYCAGHWSKAKRFCCPQLVDETAVAEECTAWRSWPETFMLEEGEAGADAVKYVAWAVIALLLAFTSCSLTLNLTKSTSFVTRKESGVLAPDFAEQQRTKEPENYVAPKRKVMYYAAGSGIPEIKTILSGFVIHGYLGGRVLFTKSVGLALSVASGLSLGKEGPFVHIASCIGNIVSRFHPKYETNEAKRREILSAACAAGVAVAFGAPIGGTLFSLEEVSYYFPPKVMWRSFFCAMIAALTLKILDPFGTGKLVLFQVSYDKDWHAYELFPFLLLGVFGGVYGAYFSKLNYRWSRYVRNGTFLKSHPMFEVLAVTLLTTAFCFLNPYTQMGGTELVYNLFAECRTGSGNNHEGLCVLDPGSWSSILPVVSAILIALVVKGALTVITFGIKVPAGIFIPTLGVGACAGRVLGILVQHLQVNNPDNVLFRSCHGDMDCIIPGLYAMVGAAAALSGVTRTTVSLAVIMFELTDTLTYAVPVMLAVLVAKTVADALEPKGIYDLVIELSQLPYLDAKVDYVWGSLTIADVTARDLDVIRVDHRNTVEDLRDQLQELVCSGNGDGGFPILRNQSGDDGLRLVGYIGANELEHALSIVADHGDSEVKFHTTFSHHSMLASSISSFMDGEEHPEADPLDFSIYMDQAPLMVSSNSPLQVVHQFFVKLGARYVVVTDSDGLYEGIIDKKTWLAFLAELEEHSG